jgi:hypothetical protein
MQKFTKFQDKDNKFILLFSYMKIKNFSKPVSFIGGGNRRTRMLLYHLLPHSSFNSYNQKIEGGNPALPWCGSAIIVNIQF